MKENTRLLIRKELALQRSSLRVAATIASVSVLSLITPIPARTELMPKLLTMGALVQAIHYLLIVPCLLIQLPVMIGASAVASERSLGTLPWELSQPTARRRLWFVKCAVVAVLALGAGVLLSLLDALVVLSMRLQHHDSVLDVAHGPQLLLLRGLWPGVYAVLCAMAGAYTSSLSRDPYRALMAGLGFVALSLGVQMLADPANLLLPKWQGSEHELHYQHMWVHYARIAFLAIVLVRLGLLNFDLVGFRLRRLAGQLVVWVVLVAVAAVVSIRVEFTLWDLPVGQKLWELPAEWGYDEKCAVVSLIGAGPNDVYYYGHTDLIRVPGTNRVLTTVNRIRRGLLVEFDLAVPRAYQYPALPDPVVEILEGHEGRTAFRLEGDVCWLPELRLAFSRRLPFSETMLNAYLGLQPRRLYPLVEKTLPGGHFEPPVSWREPDAGSDVTHRLVGGNTGLVVWERVTSSAETGTAVYERALMKWNAPGERYDIVDSFEGRGPLENYHFSSNGTWFCRAASSSAPVELRRADKASSWTIEPNGMRTYIAPQSTDGPLLRSPGDLTVFRCSFKSNMATSPDGRYLAFLRVRAYQASDISSTMAAGLPEFIEISVLNLETGEELLLGRIPPSKARLLRAPSITERLLLHGYVYGEYSDSMFHRVGDRPVRQLPLEDILSMAWSDDGKLAVLNDNMLYIFAVGGHGTPAALLLKENVADTKAEWVEFFSDRYLLLIGFDSLWRVEVNDRVKHECPVSFLPYDQGTSGCLAVIH